MLANAGSRMIKQTTGMSFLVRTGRTPIWSCHSQLPTQVLIIWALSVVERTRELFADGIATLQLQQAAVPAGCCDRRRDWENWQPRKKMQNVEFHE